MRAQIDPALVVGCALATATVALGVVASQTLRAASANPVDVLRDE